MTSSSRISFLEIPDDIYSSTNSGDWIQKPIGDLPFNGMPTRVIDGIYARFESFEAVHPLLDLDLMNEFSAWEAASDEALRSFEEDLK
jgi:hypothetical protein